MKPGINMVINIVKVKGKLSHKSKPCETQKWLEHEWKRLKRNYKHMERTDETKSEQAIPSPTKS